MYTSQGSIVVKVGGGAEISIPVRADIAQAIHLRLQESVDRWGLGRTGELSAYALLGISVAATEPDVRPPTGAQVKFALDIARRLGVEIPEGALQDRGRMGAFLTQFGPRLRK